MHGLFVFFVEGFGAWIALLLVAVFASCKIGTIVDKKLDEGNE